MPARFLDVSDVRPVPDNQEVWSDPSSDQSVVVEILVRARAWGFGRMGAHGGARARMGALRR